MIDKPVVRLSNCKKCDESTATRDLKNMFDRLSAKHLATTAIALDDEEQNTNKN